MYLKTTVRRGKGGEVRYLQLAHNQWDPQAGRSVPKILYRFGREDQLDRDAIRRLIASLARLLTPGEALAATAEGPELVFGQSRPIGGTWVLDALWRRLGIDTALRDAQDRRGRGRGRGRPRDDGAVERVLFALVANRALAPCSKLAAADWVTRDVHIDGLAEDQRRRLLPGHGPARRDRRTGGPSRCSGRPPRCSTSRSTWCSSTPPPPTGSGTPPTRPPAATPAANRSIPRPPRRSRLGGFRTFGHSKDHREDRPQVVVGMAVTRGGIPIRCWCWPGQHRRRHHDRPSPGRSAGLAAGADGVGDRPRVRLGGQPPGLQTGGGHYIQAERLRHATAEAAAALARPAATAPWPGTCGSRKSTRARGLADRRPVHRLPQPRTGHPRRRGPRELVAQLDTA